MSDGSKEQCAYCDSEGTIEELLKHCGAEHPEKISRTTVAESPAPPVPNEHVTELLTTLMSEVLYFREMKRWSPGHEKVFREVTDYLNSKVKYEAADALKES